MTIAKTRNLAAIQIDVPCPVIDQDKIVASAVHFREAHHDHDCSDGCAGCHVKPCRDISCCWVTARDSSTLSGLTTIAPEDQK
jgi:hypothetical protein